MDTRGGESIGTRKRRRFKMRRGMERKTQKDSFSKGYKLGENRHTLLSIFSLQNRAWQTVLKKFKISRHRYGGLERPLSVSSKGWQGVVNRPPDHFGGTVFID